jgi:hypothetical protein
MSDNGTYTVYTVVVEWVCSEHADEDNNHICDYCGEYIISDVPVITCDQELFKIYNLEEEAIFIVAGYSGEKLNDVKIIPLSQSSQITLASTGLDTSKSNTIKAFLWKDLKTLLPLCRNIEMSISKEE